MSAQFPYRFLIPILAVCLGVACRKADAEQPQAVVVTVTAEVPGHGAAEVENLVTTPIAFILNGMPEVQRIRCRATEGKAVVWVEFTSRTDAGKARQATTERLRLVTPQLPKAVVPRIEPVMVADEILLVALSFAGQAPEEHQRPATELREVADSVVRRRLETIPGVARVVVTGGLATECEVMVSPERLAQYAVRISELVSALERVLSEDTARLGKQSSLVVRAGLTVDDLGGLVLAVQNGDMIRLRDVAELRLRAVQPRRASMRPRNESKIPAHSAVLLGVWRQPGYDAKRLSREVDQALDALRPTLPPELSLGRQLPQQLGPLVRQMADEIQQDQPPEVEFRQETSAALGAVLARKLPPRTTITIVGPNRKHLRTAGLDLADRLGKVSGVVDLQTDSLEQAPQMRVDIDHEKAARLNVTMGDIIATIEIAHEGRKVGRLVDPRSRQAIDVVVTYGRDMGNDAEFLQNLSLINSGGELVTLGQVAKLEVATVPQSLYQQQMLPAILISCDVQAGDRAQPMAEIQRAIAAVEQQLARLSGAYHVEHD